MWWKLTVAAIAGLAIGIMTTAAVFYVSFARTSNTQAEYIPEQWSSAGKNWPLFADQLRHGSRKLLINAAFGAAKDGMSESEIRAKFGPPDLVVVGNQEFEPYRSAKMAGAKGAYFYKVGRFIDTPNKLVSEVFAIIFDSSGRVIYRLGIGINDEKSLADIASDTRSERRITP